jgi:hypothetical protein
VLNRQILEHYIKSFGPYDDSGHRFFPGAGCSAEVYRFPPTPSREVFTYAAVHAHTGMPTTQDHAEQFFAVSRGAQDVLLDLVAVCATARCGSGAPLVEWSMLPLAREIPGTRGMDRLLIAPAVLETDGFRHLAAGGTHLRFFWVPSRSVRETSKSATRRGVDISQVNPSASRRWIRSALSSPCLFRTRTVRTQLPSTAWVFDNVETRQ